MFEERIALLPEAVRDLLMAMPESLRNRVFRTFASNSPLLDLSTFRWGAFLEAFRWCSDKPVESVHSFVYDMRLSLSQALLCLLIRSGFEGSPLYLSGGKIVDIFVGNSEVYPSVESVENRLVCVYLGYSELPNKRLDECVCALLEKQRLRGKQFWLLVNSPGTLQQFKKLSMLLDTLPPEARWRYVGVSGVSSVAGQPITGRAMPNKASGLVADGTEDVI